MSDTKKRKALTILVSWLEATRTPHKVQLADPEVDILIGDTPFQITDDDAGRLVAPIDEALPAFWAMTERAGAGKPQPQFRPQAERSLLPHEDNDLVAIRHTEFRRVPNNPAVFEREDYQKIVSWAVSRFYRFNRPQLKKLGYEPEDLKTYAWLFVMNFHGLHRDVMASDAKNGGSLCNYLQQRFFGGFKTLISRNSENVTIDSETAEIALGFAVAQQWNAGRPTFDAVALAPDPVSLEDDFDALPLSVQMDKLTHFMKAGRGKDLKSIAEERLMELPNLSANARKQIYRFHVKHLPQMTADERKEHATTCSKCQLGELTAP